jgi:predicted DCC family thiol-disulfide oxidoreductase YuxK
MAEPAVIFFDGVCNLCNAAVQFVLKRDGKDYFRYASLQSDYAQQQLAKHALTVTAGDSFVLLESGRVYEQSTAALRVAKRLKGLWPLLYVFILVPPFIRNAVYNWVAKNRYYWFGKQESCWVPTPALKSKFLD